MFLSQLFARRSVVLGGFAAALAALLMLGASASAQTPRFPPGARGYERVRILQRHLQAKSTQRTVPAAQVAPKQPQYVTVRGPDGRTRTWRLDSEIIRTTQPTPSGPTEVTVRSHATGKTRTFAIEGEIIRVTPPGPVSQSQP